MLRWRTMAVMQPRHALGARQGRRRHYHANVTPAQPDTTTPLPERMRPRTLDEVVGQEHLLGKGRPLRRAIEEDAFASLVLWGPPGVGKTTVARLVAEVTRCRFVPFS